MLFGKQLYAAVKYTLYPDNRFDFLDEAKQLNLIR